MCKLQNGREWTPDSKDGVCCSESGFRRNKAKAKCSPFDGMPGYCRVGVCLTYVQALSHNTYAFVSIPTDPRTKACTAVWEGFHSTNVCCSLCRHPRSGARVALPNGAVCLMTGTDSECSHGPCNNPGTTTTSGSTITTISGSTMTTTSGSATHLLSVIVFRADLQRTIASTV